MASLYIQSPFLGRSKLGGPDCVRNKSLIRFVAVLQENMVGLSEDYLRLSQENNYPSSSGNDEDDVDSPIPTRFTAPPIDCDAAAFAKRRRRRDLR